MTIWELRDRLAEYTSQEIIDLLCDGDALSSMGITDESLDMVEELYNSLNQEG